MLDDGVPSIDVCSRIDICERQIYFGEFLAVFRHGVSVSCGCYKYRIIDEFGFLNQDYRGFMDYRIMTMLWHRYMDTGSSPA